MPNKTTSRKLYIAGGITLILFSLCLMVNIGPIIRIFAFPFIFLFGIGAYFVYAALLVLGFALAIKSQKTFFRKPLVNIGVFIFFLGFIILCTGITTFSNPGLVIDSNFANIYLDKFFNTPNTYLGIKYISYFNSDTPYGGGLLGYTFYGLMAMSGRLDLGFIVSIFILVFGLLVIISPYMIPLFKIINSNIKGKKEHNQKVRDDLISSTNKDLSKKQKEKLFFEEASRVDNNHNELSEFTSVKSSLYTPDFTNASQPIVRKKDEKFGVLTTPTLEGFEYKGIKCEVVEKIKTPELELDTTNNSVLKENTFDDKPINNESQELIDDALKTEEVINEFESVQEMNSLEDEKENISILENNEPLINEPSFETEINEIENQIVEEEIQEEIIPEVVKEVEEKVSSAKIKPVPVIEEKKEEKPVNKPKPFKWEPPSIDLLEKYETAESIELNTQEAEMRKNQINDIFQEYGIGATCVGYIIGSSVTRYHIKPNVGVQASVIDKYVDDISRQLGGVNVIFQKVIEGDIYAGLEIPNGSPSMVSFKEVFEQLPDVKKHPTSVAFGKNISGTIVKADFVEFPHLLVAGTTGSGKSIFVHSIIATLIMRMSPKELKIVLVDPKQVEMTKYRDMPHLLCPIITDADKATVCLNKLVDEMNDRYSRFADANSCSNIKEYNEYAREMKIPEMEYILVVLDEYADLVDTNKDIARPVASIAQKARAAGIHLLVATQRPSTNVINGVIKANLATRVALMCASTTDSITIIGKGDANMLIGKGDMLVNSPLISRVGAVRLQGCYISNKEINRVVYHLKQNYKTEYVEEYLDLVDHSKDVGSIFVSSGQYAEGAASEEEASYQSIKEYVMTLDSVSISKIQRDCSVGFNRAGRFVNRLQQEGIVSTEKDPNTKGLKVLVHDKFNEQYEIPVTSSEQSFYKK